RACACDAIAAAGC
ncbi:hypothetical protein A2U01_0090780, partial [Trifolium medium]|nr:hypothetical protein [Trifolium medium]